jgi:lipopolysaccharide transport system ATP-binding protein
MYMRLAFAVAAHLEPEILMVDEVLAVGDVQFQKKCLGKMDDVARQGRTVLFVSHSMSAVNKLCRYVLWMNAAQIKRFGPTHDVITAYLASDASFEGERHWEKTVEAPGNEKMRLRAVRVLNSDYEVSAAVDIRKPFHIEVEYEVFQALPGVRVACRLLAADGSVVFTSTDSSDDAWQGKTRGLNKYISRCEIPGNFLNEGQYGITVSADVPFVEIMFFEDNVLSFHVEQTGGIGGQYPEKWPGVICPKLNWHVEPL